nr:MAG TPA: hypothetical protein [Caudoviricetes sp.]
MSTCFYYYFTVNYKFLLTFMPPYGNILPIRRYLTWA